jgi:hypothetical protein
MPPEMGEIMERSVELMTLNNLEKRKPNAAEL